MFTGIVEEIGSIEGIKNGDKSSKLTIRGSKVLDKTKLGDSICTNGVCLTVTNIHSNSFEADVMAETLRKSNLGKLRIGSKVNLERALSLENNRVVTLTDTVGFVRKLPHDLVEAFKSTLEEVIYSDLLVHVIDGSVDDCLKQAAAVDEVLQEIGAGETRRIIAINKIDKGKSYVVEQVEELYEGKYPIIEISAKNGTNLKELMALFNEVLPDHLLEIEALIPYDQQKLISSVHESGVLLHESYEEQGTMIRAKILKKDFVKFEPFIIEGGDHEESNH